MTLDVRKPSPPQIIKTLNVIQGHKVSGLTEKPNKFVAAFVVKGLVRNEIISRIPTEPTARAERDRADNKYADRSFSSFSSLSRLKILVIRPDRPLGAKSTIEIKRIPAYRFQFSVVPLKPEKTAVRSIAPRGGPQKTPVPPMKTIWSISHDC